MKAKLLAQSILLFTYILAAKERKRKVDPVSYDKGMSGSQPTKLSNTRKKKNTKESEQDNAKTLTPISTTVPYQYAGNDEVDKERRNKEDKAAAEAENRRAMLMQERQAIEAEAKASTNGQSQSTKQDLQMMEEQAIAEAENQKALQAQKKQAMKTQQTANEHDESNTASEDEDDTGSSDEFNSRYSKFTSEKNKK